MIAITGASGQLGRLTVEAVLTRGVPAGQVVAIVRNPDKIADLAERGVVVRSADYDEPSSWTAALDGVHTLLLVSSNEMGQRVRQHTAVIDAAKASGVRRVAYTSILKADTSTSALAPEHVATEQALISSGLDYTVLRNSWYLENYLDQAGQFIAQGEILSSAGPVPFTAATRADYAAAAAEILIEDGHENATYELGGGKITVAGMAAAISDVSGTVVALRAVGPDEHREILLGAGVPEGYAGLLVDIDRVIAAGELDTDSDDLVRLVGHPLTTLTDAATAALQDA